MKNEVVSGEGLEPVAAVLMDRHEKALAMVQALSPREAEVLHCLVDGCPSKEIADRLGVSPRTVEIHRCRVLKKLKVRTSLAAVCIGAYAGFGNFDHLGPVAEREPVEVAATVSTP